MAIYVGSPPRSVALVLFAALVSGGTKESLMMYVSGVGCDVTTGARVSARPNHPPG